MVAGILAVVAAATLAIFGWSASSTSQDPKALTADQLARAYDALPLSFEANAGRYGDRVDYVSRGAGYTLAVSPTQAVLGLDRSTVAMRLAGASADSDKAVGEPLPGRVNHFIGAREDWRTNIPTYSQVLYEDVYDGVDVTYHGNQGQLEYDFVVAPGADPRQIELRFAGVEAVERAGNGDLGLETTRDTIRQLAPQAYQETSAGREPVESRFVVGDDGSVRFALGDYDPQRELVIDPVIQYSTYLGSTDEEFADDIAVDSTGHAYVTGRTASNGFPTTVGVFDTTRDAVDAFVTKFNPAGSALIYSTFLGGSGEDIGEGIALDSSDNAYVTGTDHLTVHGRS